MDALSALLGARQPLSAIRSLTRFTAQLAGLMSLVTLRRGEARSAKAWVRTARLAALELDDARVRAWTLAEEAYADFYVGDFKMAAIRARAAQEASPRPTVGAALAAPLEARAHAVLGNSSEAEASLRRAEQALAGLRGDETDESAFGYNEAQLRFHEGSVYTHLGDTRRAKESHKRALELYPEGQHLDRGLIHLDSAVCLIHDGEPAAAAEVALQTLLGVPEEFRMGILFARAQQLRSHLPADASASSSVRTFRSTLADLEPTGVEAKGT